MSYQIRKDGEWFDVSEEGGYLLQCCDCGLVHRVNFKLKEGKLWMQAFRDNRRTGQVRRMEGGRLWVN